MSTNGDDDELEQLRQETDVGTRADSSTPSESSGDLEAAIIEVLEEIEAGETGKTLSLRDGRLTALIRGLEETDGLEDVGTALQEELEREVDPDAVDRSEVLRLAVRLGLQEAAPDVVDAAREGYAEHASDQF